jgi:YbbR domain-containing protein
MLSSLGRNLRTLLWALVLGLAVWIAAVTSADPDEVRALPAPVTLEVLGQDPGLVITSEVPASVRITVRAPESISNRLSANPDSVRAILDLSGLEQGEHRLVPQIQVDARPSRVVAVDPASILLKLEPLLSKSFTVQSAISGQPAIGYQAGDLKLEPEEVVISGPQSTVDLVARVRVVVNISGIREPINEDFQVQALDASNAGVERVTISPSSVHVSLPVARQGGFRDMAVKVVVQGQVAAGYRLDNISVFPPVVTVYSSDADLVGRLPGVVETQPLQLDGASSNLSLRVPLVLPTGVSVVGEQTVLIQAGVSPVQSSFTLAGQEVLPAGLADNLDAQISPSTVDVSLSGPIPTLDTLGPQDIQVTVDVTDLEAGTYQLTPTVQILTSDVEVESINPGAVEVVLIPKGQATASP